MAAERRRIFVGDLQGCRVEFELLLEELRFDPAADELHPVGDFVNRGPDSLGVLRLARELDAGGVLGNHDVHLLRCAAGKRKLLRKDTLDELLAAEDREELLGWLAARPFVRRFDELLLVHAALNPTWPDPYEVLHGVDPLEVHADTDFATRARYCTVSGARPRKDWPEPPAPFRPWHELLPDGERWPRRVVYGHWARAGLVIGPRLRGLDSACVWGGKLTAWIEQEDRLVQVDATRTWSTP